MTCFGLTILSVLEVSDGRSILCLLPIDREWMNYSK